MSSLVVSGDVSGSVTLSAPSAAGSVVVTLPSASGTMLTSATPFSNGQGPAFSAYLASTQTVTAATFTKLTFNTKVFDTNSNFDATTNYRFTPTISGYYQFTLNIQGAANATYILAVLYKNGVVYSYGNVGPGIAGAGSASIASALISMNGSTDYVEAYVYTSGGALQAAGGATNTQFQAAMVRGA